MSDTDESSNNSIESSDLEEEETDEIELTNIIPISLPKPKARRTWVGKPRTDKQLEMLAKGRANRQNNIRLQNEAKKIREAEEKKLLEEKIVQKAISIKKKQIKKEKVLDMISDDDTPKEEIIQKITKKKSVIPPARLPQPPPQHKDPTPVASKFVFV